MPSYHLGLSSLVRASKRTWDASVRTCSKQQLKPCPGELLHRHEQKNISTRPFLNTLSWLAAEPVMALQNLLHHLQLGKQHECWFCLSNQEAVILTSEPLQML